MRGMTRRMIWTAALLTLMTVLTAGAARAEGRVFMAGEAEPFAPEEALLHVYICPLLGADARVLIQGEQVMLVDMGKDHQADEIMAVLDSLGIEHINVAFNTHPHDDHVGALPKLLKRYSFGFFVTGFPEDLKRGKSVIQRETMAALAEAEVKVIRMDDGDGLYLGEAEARVIRLNEGSLVNPRSCMLLVRFGECSILLAADVTAEAQRELARTRDGLKAEILKYPHHGLGRLAKEFLKAVSPEYAVFTHGSKNTKAAQGQLKASGVDFGFATWGVIHLSTNGQYWLVEQKLTPAGKRYQQELGR